jgi:hypothetical protein
MIRSLIDFALRNRILVSSPAILRRGRGATAGLLPGTLSSAMSALRKCASPKKVSMSIEVFRILLCSFPAGYLFLRLLSG